MAIKICLDAGHSGKYNRSPVVPEYYESDMNWKLHLMLKGYLEQAGFEIVTTRERLEEDPERPERGMMAKGCDLFISVHSNAAYDTDEYKAGLAKYTKEHGTASGYKHEDEDVDRVDVYATLDGKAHTLAQALADTIADVMETDQIGSVKTREYRGGEYYGVLQGAAAVGVPGMLVEHSFHTNRRAAKWLLDDANLDRLARAEADVIAAYYGMGGGTAGLTPIEGQARADVWQMQEYIKSVNPDVEQSVIDMIPLYIAEGAVEGIRGDIAFAQSCLETGNFGFKGSAVTPDMNNFCGMGVTMGREGNAFDTPQQGIRAQIQHLMAYANDKEPVNKIVDPRFDKVLRGCAPYVEWLGIQENPQGKGWASGEGYGEKILGILARILAIGVRKKLGDRTLRKGDEGEDVRELQELLMVMGYDLGACGADGEYGRMTEEAVSEFQRGFGPVFGLKVDGVYGPATHAALVKLMTPEEPVDPEKPEDDPEKPEDDPADEPDKPHWLMIEGDEDTLRAIQQEHGGRLLREE